MREPFRRTVATWILLRGLTREARHWGDFGGALRNHVAAAPLVALDLPGFGERRDERSPASIAALVDACRAALGARAIAPPYRLVGLSLGAMVALEWAARHAVELHGVVALNTSAGGLAPWHRRLRPRHYAQLVAALCTRDDAAAERTVLRLTARHPSVVPACLLARWTAWRRERPWRRSDALRQLWAAARFDVPPAPPPTPLLVLAGACDGLVDPQCSVALARAWHADLRVHPTAGHDLSLDDPEWVAREIAAWVARTGARQALSCRGSGGDSAPAGRQSA